MALIPRFSSREAEFREVQPQFKGQCPQGIIFGYDQSIMGINLEDGGKILTVST